MNSAASRIISKSQGDITTIIIDDEYNDVETEINPVYATYQETYEEIPYDQPPNESAPDWRHQVAPLAANGPGFGQGGPGFGPGRPRQIITNGLISRQAQAIAERAKSITDLRPLPDSQVAAPRPHYLIQQHESQIERSPKDQMDEEYRWRSFTLPSPTTRVIPLEFPMTPIPAWQSNGPDTLPKFPLKNQDTPPSGSDEYDVPNFSSDASSGSIVYSGKNLIRISPSALVHPSMIPQARGQAKRPNTFIKKIPDDRIQFYMFLGLAVMFFVWCALYFPLMSRK